MDNYCNQCGNPLNGKYKCEKCGNINGGAFNVISDKVKSYDYKGKAEALKAKANETIDKAKSYDYKEKADKIAKAVKDFDYEGKAKAFTETIKNYDYKLETENIKRGGIKYFWNKHRKLSLCVLCFVIVSCVSLCFENNFKAKKIQKIYPELSDIKIVCSESLRDSWEYVLFHVKTNNDGAYLCDAIDFKKEVNYNAIIANPFYSLCAYVWTQSDEETNKKLFYEMKKSIDKGGLGYFNDIKNSSAFLRKVSGVDGIIPTADARNMMILSFGLMYGEDMVNELSQKEDYRILFEYKNAYPKVIAYKTTEMAYNWSISEDMLKFYSEETMSVLEWKYGPPYSPQTKWRYSVVDEETGQIEGFVNYCVSLEDVKSKYDVYEIGDTENGKYKGEWKDGVRNGQGTYNYANGDKYDGEWKDGKRHGQGTIYYDNGKYEGAWINDKKSGQGTYHWNDGDKYEGEWKDDVRAGQGTYYWPNGDRYEGEWKDGKRHGQGTMYYADGSTWAGKWVNNEKDE